uniref:Uncharacterized protein n=1 Tax=Glossina austeni TaxID=7395 RepID=A0A1A9UWZ5_GLOAU
MGNFPNTNDESISLTKPNKTSRNTKTALKRRWRRLERGNGETKGDLNEALTCQHAKVNGHIRFVNQEEGLQYNDKANEEKDPAIPSSLRRKQDLNSFSTGKAYEPPAKRSLLNMNSVSNSSIAHHQPPITSTSCVNNGVDRDNDIATAPLVSYQCNNLNDFQSTKESSRNVALSKADLRKSIINSESNSISVKKDESSVRNSHLKRKLLSNVKAAHSKPGTSTTVNTLTVNVDENINQTTKRNCVPDVDRKGLRGLSERSMATKGSKESELVDANRQTVAYSGGRKAGRLYQERKTGLFSTTPAGASRQSKPIPCFANQPNFPLRLEKNDPVFAHISQSGNISPQPATALICRQFNANCTSTDRRIVSFSNGQPVYGGTGDYNKNQSSADNSIKRASLTLIRPNLSLSNVPTCLDRHLIISNATKRILSSLNGTNTLLIEAMKIANNLRVHAFQPWAGFNKNKSNASDVLRLSRVRTPYSRRTVQRKRSENIRQTTEHDTDATTILPIESPYTLPANDELYRHTNKIRNKITHFGYTVSASDLTDEASTPPINLPKIAFPVMEALLQFDKELTTPPVSSGIPALSKQRESTIKCKLTQDDQSSNTLTISTVRTESILAAGASTFDAQNMKLKYMECSKVSSLTHCDQDGNHCKRESVSAALSNNKETLISPEAIALENSSNSFGSEFKNQSNNKPEFADMQKTLSNI